MIHALDIQRARATALSRELLARTPAGAIDCIFAGGSLARGEVWAVETGAGLEVYSDVDLYVVVHDEAAFAPVRAAVASAVAALPAIDGVHFLRAPDVGVYTRADLLAQPARPGTLDLSVNHLMLHGDAAVVKSLPSADPARMVADEALYLLENRAAELPEAGAVVGDAGARADLVRALKSRLEVHTAHAIVDGSFVPTLAGRAQRFASAPPAMLDASARAELEAAYRAAADPAAWVHGRDAAVETARSRREIARAWRTLAPVVLGAHAGTAADVLLARRCRAGARRANARELFRLRHPAGVSWWRAMTAALALSRLSPGAALRVDALARQLRADGGLDERHAAAHERYLDGLTRRFGFTAGSQEMRVRAMHRVIS